MRGGAVHEVWLVWAPYQVPPDPAHTSQQIPLDARTTMVMPPPLAELATLITDELVDGPSM